MKEAVRWCPPELCCELHTTLGALKCLALPRDVSRLRHFPHEVLSKAGMLELRPQTKEPRSRPVRIRESSSESQYRSLCCGSSCTSGAFRAWQVTKC